MAKESFLVLLENDSVERESNSSDKTNLSVLSSSIDSGIASSLDSNVGMDCSLPNSPSSFLKDYLDTLPITINSDHSHASECSQFDFPDNDQNVYHQVDGNFSVSSENYGITKQPGDYAQVISLAVPNIQGHHREATRMDNQGQFDHYTRTSYMDIRENRHELDLDYVEFPEALPSGSMDEELRFEDTLQDYNLSAQFPEAEAERSMSSLSQNNPDGKIVDIKKRVKSGKSPDTENVEHGSTEQKTQKKSTESPGDKRKYKRRKDLTYESVVEVMR